MRAAAATPACCAWRRAISNGGAQGGGPSEEEGLMHSDLLVYLDGSPLRHLPSGYALNVRLTQPCTPRRRSPTGSVQQVCICGELVMGMGRLATELQEQGARQQQQP